MARRVGKKARKKDVAACAAECEKSALSRTLRANPGTDEAKVWGQLQGKGATMQLLQQQFMRDFKQEGFGMVQGSRWSSYCQHERYTQDDEYMTYEQIFAAEKKSALNTEAKITWAKSPGEGKAGTPAETKGWYKDPTRNDAPVPLPR